MSDKRPIGIFDSGVGGLTVTRALIQRMPAESFVYFGDTAHVPYGNKSREQLFSYARQIIQYLLQREVKAIMVACGTHSSITIPKIRGDYDVPIIGMVRPGAQAALQATRNGRIGVIATEATIKSRSFSQKIKELKPDCEVYETACPKFVPLIENGQCSGLETTAAIKEYLSPMVKQGIDTLVFGCTHYPFLEEPIAAFTNGNVCLVDPARQAVEDLYKVLKDDDLLNKGKSSTVERQFVVSGDADSFFRVGRMLIGNVITKVEGVSLELEEVV